MIIERRMPGEQQAFLVNRLGGGEYGQVYKVKNKKNGMTFALKKVNIASSHVSYILIRKRRRFRPSEKSKL